MVERLEVCHDEAWSSNRSLVCNSFALFTCGWPDGLVPESAYAAESAGNRFRGWRNGGRDDGDLGHG